MRAPQTKGNTMKKLRFTTQILLLILLLCTPILARTHRLDIVAIDTIEYTLEEDDSLMCELFIEEDGLYNVKLTQISTTGTFSPKVSISLSQKSTELYSIESDKQMLADDGSLTESFEFIVGLTPGEYKLEIQNETKFSDVTFRLETTFTEEKNIENADNHSFESATVIERNEKYFGGVTMHKDIDFFAFEMPCDGYAYIEMYSPSLKYFTLYDGDRREIGGIGLEIDEQDKIYELKTGLSKGKYYISVRPEDDYTLPPYSIEFKFVEGDGFEKEYNNQKEFATPIALGKEYTGNLFGADDEDVYSITVPEKCNITLDFTDTLIEKDGHYSIYLDDGKNILFSSDECGRESVKLSLEKGTYYFTVSGLGDSRFTSMSYKLKVTSDRHISAQAPDVSENTDDSGEGTLNDEKLHQFDDVKEGKWYYNELLTAKSLGLINGTGDNLYKPEDSVKLSEVIAMACRVYSTKNGAQVDFSLTSGSWYQPYIDYAIDNGIIDENEFSDYEAIAARAETAYIFAGIFDGEASSDISIPDVDSKTKYHDEIKLLYSLEILKGDDEKGTFYPDRNLTRAEAAAILLRVYRAA